MRALVVNPWIIDFKLYDEWMHPLGLYFLISLLRHNGWKADYVNCIERPADAPQRRFSTGAFSSVEIDKPAVYRSIPRKLKRHGIAGSELTRRIADLPRPDAVFIGSAMTYWLPGVSDTITVIENVLPDVPIIVGGVGATLFPGYLARLHPKATIHAGTLPEHGRSMSIASGIHLSSDGWVPTLTDGIEAGGRHSHGPILASMGCPLSCTYCASRLLHPGYECRKVETVIAEMRPLFDRYDVRDFAFYDDALLHGNGEHLLALLDAAAGTGMTGLRLHTPNGMHLQWVNDLVLDRMKSAGFVTMRFGYESSHANQSAATSGKISRAMTGEKLALVRKHGFDPRDIGVYVMAGLDGQSPGDVIDDMRFIHSLGVQAKPVFISPVPGTPLFERYAEQFPPLKNDPLWHNDMFFITQLDGWDWDAAERIRVTGKELNAAISGPVELRPERMRGQ